MKHTISVQSNLLAGITICAVMSLDNLVFAEGEFINQFGNFQGPRIEISTPVGIPTQRDSGSTSGGPSDDITVDEGIEILFNFQKLVEDVENLPPASDAAAQEERDELIEDLNGLNDALFLKASNISSNSGIGPPLPLGTEVTFNVTGVGELANALRGLPQAQFVTNDDVRAIVNILADTDPYTVLQGSFTNTSETEDLSIFLPFELAFDQPIALDADLVRQFFVEVSVEDTNGDGEAFVQNAGLSGIQILATADILDPTFSNTEAIGTTEGFGVSRIRDDFAQQRLSTVREVNSSRIDRFIEEDDLISHLTGLVQIDDLSPGDTINFTAVVSLGIEGDPETPLLPADALGSVIGAARLIAETNTSVPEPTSAVLALVALLGIGIQRRH